MDKKIEKAHVEIDNLAVPEVRFGDEVLSNDVERDDMHVYSDNLAIPEVRVGKIAKEINAETKAHAADLVEAESKPEETDSQATTSPKKAYISSDNLAIPEVRYEEETPEEIKDVKVKKMHIDYSGAIPQVTYTEE